MIDPSHLLAFCAAAFVLIITPGPNFVYILTRGTTQGRGPALWSALGLGCGVMAHTLLAVLGLSALLRSSVVAFQVVKLAGGAYLIYLGIKTLHGQGRLVTHRSLSSGRPLDLIRQSITASLLNPKTGLFFLTFLPQFVRVEQGHAALQMVLLGAIYMLFTLAVYGMVACFAGGIGNWLSASAQRARRAQWAAGGIFIGLGITAARR